MKSVRYILLTFLAFTVPGFAAVTVTSPANNATVSSPVNYVATATTTTCAKGVASMGIYVSNKLIYVVDGHSMNTTISLSPGTYNTVVEEWDYCKGASVTPIKITVGTAPSTTGVVVTSPLAGSTVASPVNYVATATTSACAKGVASMGIYVDNKLVYVVDAAQMNTSLSMAAGAEHTVVEEWDHCGKAAYTTVNLTVGSVTAPAVSISASPASIAPGSSSTLTVVATNATQVTITGTDGSSYTLPASGGTQVVSPTTTTTYSVVAAGAKGNASAVTTVTVTAKTLTAISVSPSTDSLAAGATEQFTATATYSDKSTANVTTTATWAAANTAVATINSSGLATAVASGSTQITASLNGIAGNAALTVTAPSSGGANVVTWHFDAQRSGLNPGEQSLTPSNVAPTTFGKLFSYLVDGYMYAEPLLVSGLTVNGGTHNVVYVATEHDSVYAFDADNYGSGTPLWQVSLLQSGETPVTTGEIQPYEGVTSTPVIDLSSNTMYLVSIQASAGGTASFRLNALDILTGAQKFGGPDDDSGIGSGNRLGRGKRRGISTPRVYTAGSPVTRERHGVHRFRQLSQRMVIGLQCANPGPNRSVQCKPQPGRRRHVCQCRRRLDGQWRPGLRWRGKYLRDHRERPVGWEDGFLRFGVEIQRPAADGRLLHAQRLPVHGL